MPFANPLPRLPTDLRPATTAMARAYPQATVAPLTAQRAAADRVSNHITLTITLSPLRSVHAFGQFVSELLFDLYRNDRWICVDDGSSEADCEQMQALYSLIMSLTRTK